MKFVAALALGAMMSVSMAPAAYAKKEDDSATGDPNRVICKKMAVTGSRLKKTRLCYTARQWEDMRKDTRQTVEAAQMQNGKSN